MTGAVFVVAGPGGAQRGPVAAMVSTAGWANAASRELGSSWIVTPGGVIDPAKARQRATPRLPSQVRARELRVRLPVPVKTGLKDLREQRRGRRFRVDAHGPWEGHDLEFVWQRHELFQSAGLRLADALDVPSVLFVPAPIVWEAERWGTHRPGWGSVLKMVGERPALTRAKLVACGTAEIAAEVERMGVDPDRILVTPTGVDLDLFDVQADRERVRSELGISDRFVIGWVGSFRRFHATEQLLLAAAGVDDAVLMLVGDGPERSRIQALAEKADIELVLTGMVPHDRLVHHLAAMDAAVVLAREGQQFHYSPLKVAEYLAAGVPVVAPRIGQLAERLHDGRDSILVAPGDPEDLRNALRQLRADPDLRLRLSRAGRAEARRSWSWDEQVRRVVCALDRLGDGRGPSRRTP
jgi:glycosyltransferase involved in cell wall biosynthesis